MRRKDREITDFGEIVKVMEECDVCRLALNDESGYPYILPLNFGMRVKDGQITLYFHGAAEGKKYDLIAKDNRASFEMDCGHNLLVNEYACTCTMEYRSVIGRGTIEILPEEEKYNALCVLMEHYHKEGFPVNRKVIPMTTVFKLSVSEVTGKIRAKKQG